jgi:hypothetical protein
LFLHLLFVTDPQEFAAFRCSSSSTFATCQFRLWACYYKQLCHQKLKQLYQGSLKDFLFLSAKLLTRLCCAIFSANWAFTFLLRTPTLQPYVGLGWQSIFSFPIPVFLCKCQPIFAVIIIEFSWVLKLWICLLKCSLWTLCTFVNDLIFKKEDNEIFDIK